ncbi:TonB-dependent receptor plug domain-containing protein, partial [Daejeonella sp.]|uniref:TonB-dependent receptor plug domain-containing protein n=1 Tax=Daejeonella sp. TaxID=2805397 RepID=UPI003782EB37
MIIFTRLFLVLFVISITQAFANSQTNAYRIETHSSFGGNSVAQTALLKDVLKDLEKTHHVSIMFNSRLFENTRVNITEFKNENLETSLNKVLSSTNFKFKKIASEFYVISKNDKGSDANQSAFLVQESENFASANVKSESSIAENKNEEVKQVSITGTITDAATGETLPGVVINFKGSTLSTTSNQDGKYSILLKGPGVLVFSYIGYVKQEVAVTNTSTIVNVKLATDQQNLTEVVVVGYGTQQKRNLTGSIASVGSKGIKDIAVTSFENAIQGQIAGVQVQEPSGEPGAATTIRVRGIGSISAGNEPLYVVDGFPISKNVDPGVQGDVARRTVAFRPAPSNPLGTISAGDIQSVEVLKDAAAAAIYGSRGSNGVILITTKKGKRDGTPVVNFDSYYGVQTLANKVDLMNAAELSKYVLEAKNNA